MSNISEHGVDFSKLLSDGGHYKTRSIFYEFKYDTKSDYIPYTLGERDRKGSLSMYRIYMDSETEYEAAMTLLNSWKHWEILTSTTWFQEHITKWRDEREIREAAIGKAVLISQAREGNVAAAKAIHDFATKRKAGRPSKDRVEGEVKRQAAVDSKVSNILDRMSSFDA